MSERCWVAIVYDWGDDGLTIAKTADDTMLGLVKQQVIRDAKQRLSISSQIDAVICLLDEAEVQRLGSVPRSRSERWSAENRQPLPISKTLYNCA